MAVTPETLVEELKAAKFGSDKPETLLYAAKLMIVNDFTEVKQLASTDFDNHWQKRLLPQEDAAKCTAGTAAFIKQLIAQQTKLMEANLNQNCAAGDNSQTSGVLFDVMSKALKEQKKGKHDIVVDLQSKVSNMQLVNVGHDLWPKADSVNVLANQKAAAWGKSC